MDDDPHYAVVTNSGVVAAEQINLTSCVSAVSRSVKSLTASRTVLAWPMHCTLPTVPIPCHHCSPAHLCATPEHSAGPSTAPALIFRRPQPAPLPRSPRPPSPSPCVVDLSVFLVPHSGGRSIERPARTPQVPPFAASPSLLVRCCPHRC